MDGQFVAYYRVSTTKQGVDGLGMAAQRQAVSEYLNGGAWELVGEFADVESGKRDDRPELVKAIDLCRLTKARLLIAKLDRLSRDVHFLSGLEKRGIDFVACDMPTANRFTVHIMAAVAQQEREVISKRTRDGLQRIKAQIEATGSYATKKGRIIHRLGNPTPSTRPDHIAGVAEVRRRADEFASTVAPIIEPMRSSGLSFGAIAKRLNASKIRSPRGNLWTAMTVKRVLDRLPIATVV